MLGAKVRWGGLDEGFIAAAASVSPHGCVSLTRASAVTAGFHSNQRQSVPRPLLCGRTLGQD